MSPIGSGIAQRLALALQDLREHEKEQPAEVEQLVGTRLRYLRSWKPESVSPLGTLLVPKAPIRDPRGTP